MNFLFQFFLQMLRQYTISREELLLPSPRKLEDTKINLSFKRRALAQCTLTLSYKVVIVIDVLDRNAILPRESEESNKWTNSALNFMLLSRRRRHFQE